MELALVIVFGILSAAVCGTACWYAIRLYKSEQKANQIFTPIQVFTAGVFVAVWLLFIPHSYLYGDFGDAFAWIVRPLLIAAHSALRVFVVDMDVSAITGILHDATAWWVILPRVLFTVYAVVLYVLAPVLTFTNVVFLFRNVIDEIYFAMSTDKTYYIMSELNEKSLVLARSIYEKHKEANDAMIVFTDVFVENKEDDFEQMTKAKELHAIFLKRDIANLDILSKKGAVELFLIGQDESENIRQAVRITTKLNEKNTKHNVKVFVFCSKPVSAGVMNLVRYENLLQYACDREFDENTFKLRRIDERRQLIWSELPKMKPFDIAQKHNNTLSVLIVGFGSYGMEFFKALLWYCQFEGYKLEINIVDGMEAKKDGSCSIQTIINGIGPELLKMNRKKIRGEAQYDIKTFCGIDVQTAQLDELLLKGGTGKNKASILKRLKRTNLVLVALGNDDDNIDTAIRLRRLCDRLKNFTATKKTVETDEQVEIYSVVYDELKVGIDETQGEAFRLTNYQEVPYHIRFIGGISTQYRYENIYDAKLEQSAYKHHIGWVDIEEQIYNEWKASGEKNVEDYEWAYMYGKGEDAKRNAKKKYERHEYFRLSSTAKELYQRAIRENAALRNASVCCEKTHRQTCECENCQRRKRSEHMRWNAYMRTLGYEYRKNVRDDRALYHPDLCKWDELPELEKLKD